MYKKTILSIAIASTISLTGCLENDKLENKNDGVTTAPPPTDITYVDGNGATVTTPIEPNYTYPIFDPLYSALPLPIDLIFDKVAQDGTFLVTDSKPPVTTALNSLSGASTTAPIDIKMSGFIDPSTVVADRSVFLIELEYASGSPVQALSAKEPPTIIPANQPSFAVEVKELDDTSYIRIIPKSPLDPLKRYVVAITNAVMDMDENPIQQSPSYRNITTANLALVSGALQPIRDLMNGLWEPFAVGFINSVRASLPEPLAPLEDTNIALSYSFTTSGDEKVLNYIADPAQWFFDQISGFIGVTAAKTVMDYANNGANKLDLTGVNESGSLTGLPDGKTNYYDVLYAKLGATAAFPANLSASAQATLGAMAAAFPALGLDADPGTVCPGVTGGATYVLCISKVLGHPTYSPFKTLLPTPKAATITFDDTGAMDAYSISSLTASSLAAAGVPAGTVSVVQGELTIPYYLSIPSETTGGVPLVTNSWVANDTLATAINTAFAPLGLSIPQANPAVSKVVNYIFPFPKKQADVTIPILAIHPTNPAGPMKTVIFQHGITTDRSAALVFGSSMVAGAKLTAATDIAVIAIDQPLHGIDAISDAAKAGLAEKLLYSGGSLASTDGVFDGVDADASDQAKITGTVNGTLPIGVLQAVQAAPCPALTGLTLNGTVPADIVTATTLVTAGSCGGAAKAQLAGAQTLVRTIANGASTIPGLGQGSDDERHFGFHQTTPGTAPIDMVYSGTSAIGSSGSMFMNLTSFLTSRDNNREQVLDLLAVRKSVGTIDLNPSDADGTDLDSEDVYFIGHSLGTVDGIPFVAVANDSTTATDDIIAANFIAPGGGITRFLENSTAMSPRILGGLATLGLTQDTSSFQTYINVLQATLDAYDPINFVQDFADDEQDTPVLFTEFVGDEVNEIVADTVIPNSVDEEDELLNPELGSISFLSGTEPLATESGATDLTSAGVNALGQRIVRFTAGFHETPVFPSTGTNAEKAAFAELVGQATSMVVSGGAAVAVTNATVIQPAP